MRELLPYYERELTVLKRHSREFAEQYPKVAGRLMMSGEAVEDPHIERLIQSFALLAARVHKKLDDEYPELTNALFQTLYPQYLRPFPACSIARFDAALAQLPGPVPIPRGTRLQSQAVRGVACRFQTAYDVTLAPLAIDEALFGLPPTPPAGAVIPSSVNAALTLCVSSLSETLALDTLLREPVRIYLDAEPSVIALIHEALFERCLTLAVDTGAGPWQTLAGSPAQPVGFAPEQALVADDARSHAAYRLLTEYFAFPDKFNFVDLDLRPLAGRLRVDCRRVRLHFMLSVPRDDHRLDRLLDNLTPANFQLHCTPVVNLFRQAAEPIRVNHQDVEYTVQPDARRPQAFEVYSVDRVVQVREHGAQVSTTDFHPFYSLKHDATRREGHYWHLVRNEQLAELSPGFEYQISIVDPDFNPTHDSVETLSIELTCTNRDLPSQLPIGQVIGDLMAEGLPVIKSAQFLRKPTQAYRFRHGGDGAWRLVSQLALNHWSAFGDGQADDRGDGLRELLTLYDLPRNQQNRRAIDGIVGVKTAPTTTRVAGNPFPTFVRGVEIRVAVRADHFVGTGVWLFAELLSHVAGLAVHLNSFTRVVLEDADTGQVLRTCPARSGLRAIV